MATCHAPKLQFMWSNCRENRGQRGSGQTADGTANRGTDQNKSDLGYMQITGDEQKKP